MSIQTLTTNGMFLDELSQTEIPGAERWLRLFESSSAPESWKGCALTTESLEIILGIISSIACSEEKSSRGKRSLQYCEQLNQSQREFLGEIRRKAAGHGIL
jgi:hypothetical protein